MGMNIITDDKFDEDVIQSEKPVLVDFWAQWCGPCRMLVPVLDEIADEIKDEVTIVKMNVDENPETPAKLGVRGIPSLMLFKDGQLKETRVGGLPKSDMIKWIKDSIAA